MYFVLAAVIAGSFALGWAFQLRWEAEMRPCKGVAVAFGGGAMKLRIDGNDSPLGLFPPSDAVEAPLGLSRWVRERSVPMEWGFRANMSAAKCLYLISIPMWCPVALFGFLATHFRLQQRFVEKMGHKRCVNCGQDRHELKEGQSCPGCGAKRMQKWAA
jgi:hypothetical protein